MIKSKSHVFSFDLSGDLLASLSFSGSFFLLPCLDAKSPSGLYCFWVPNLNGGAMSDPSMVSAVAFDMIVATLRSLYSMGLPAASDPALFYRPDFDSSFFASAPRASFLTVGDEGSLGSTCYASLSSPWVSSLKPASTSALALFAASFLYSTERSLSGGTPMFAAISWTISSFCLTICSAVKFSMNLKCCLGIDRASFS